MSKLKCPLLPVGAYYVVSPDAAAEQRGHIFVNAAYAAQPQRGTIVAWGPDTTELRNGDYCCWRQHAGTTVAVGAAHWLLLKEEDIVCRLEQ